MRRSLPLAFLVAMFGMSCLLPAGAAPATGAKVAPAAMQQATVDGTARVLVMLRPQVSVPTLPSDIASKRAAAAEPRPMPASSRCAWP